MMDQDMMIVQGQRLLRRGYTTGTTAAGATKRALLSIAESLGDVRHEPRYKDFVKESEGEKKQYRAEVISIRTIKGITVSVELDDCLLTQTKDGLPCAKATTIKESGDDPDVTHGAAVSSCVFFDHDALSEPRESKEELQAAERGKHAPASMKPRSYWYGVNLRDFSFEELELDEAAGLRGDFGIVGIVGGRGVGLVTQKGLAPRKGHSAINPVPRQMLMQEVVGVLAQSEQLLELLRHTPMRIEISVADGEEIAKKTFNPKLGIVGGISILGTSGIVEPMSEKALVDTIRTELEQFCALKGSKPLLICPGNYGQAFAKERLRLDLEKSVKISNYIGDSLDYIVFLGLKEILLVGHAGKLLKLGASVMNTHSSYADARQEVMASHAAICGASRDTLGRIMEAISIEEMLDALLAEDEEIFAHTMRSIGKAMKKSIDHRTKERTRVEFIVFTNSHGTVLQSDGAQELLQRLWEDFGVQS